MNREELEEYWKSGKYYTSERGYKVMIYNLEFYPTIHAAEISSNGWDVVCLDAEEISSPWIDKPVVDWSAMPKWAKSVAKSPGGSWWWFEDRNITPYLNEHFWGNVGMSGEIPDAYAPKWEGDWNDSLVVRPEGV